MEADLRAKGPVTPGWNIPTKLATRKSIRNVQPHFVKKIKERQPQLRPKVLKKTCRKNSLFILYYKLQSCPSHVRYQILLYITVRQSVILWNSLWLTPLAKPQFDGFDKVLRNSYTWRHQRKERMLEPNSFPQGLALFQIFRQVLLSLGYAVFIAVKFIRTPRP